MKIEIQYSAKDFERAAQIHKESCDILLNTSSLSKEAKERIMCEVYYLSGYILECSFKFHIIRSYHSRPDTLLSKAEFEEKGLLSHDLNSLLQLMLDKCKYNRNEFIEWNSSEGNYGKKWVVDCRYKKTSIDFIESYYRNVVVCIFDKLKKK